MRLPKSVQEIADVIGRDRALYLVGQLPRCTTRDKRYPNASSSHVILYVPTLQRLRIDHPLVHTLGWSDAEKLCKHFGGEILKPGTCAEVYRAYRDTQILRLHGEGLTTAHIAAIFGVTAETVRSVIRKAQNPQEEIPKAANDNAPVKRRARAANGQSD